MVKLDPVVLEKSPNKQSVDSKLAVIVVTSQLLSSPGSPNKHSVDFKLAVVVVTFQLILSPGSILEPVYMYKV